MPYGIRKQGNKWVVYNKDTGDVKGTHSTEESAESQRRLLYALKSPDFKPRGK